MRGACVDDGGALPHRQLNSIIHLRILSFDPRNS